MGNHKGEIGAAVSSKSWKQIISQWHERRGEKNGTVLVVNHANHYDVMMVDGATGRWQVTVPQAELADAMVLLMARSNVDILALGATVPPIPRGPNPPPPPGHPLIRQVLTAVNAVRNELEVEQVNQAVERMHNGANF